MSTTPWKPKLPPLLRTESGELRRIGVEIELIGPEIETLSRIVAEEVGGSVEVCSAYEHLVHGDPAGDWGVELDFEYLKRKEREAPEVPEGVIEQLGLAARGVLGAGASAFVPLEVVSPPIEMERLAFVQRLIERLRREGALGTRAGIAYAFGMQLNPEMPSLSAPVITRYLKSFLCLEEWLLKRSEVDATRELTRFAVPFPLEYVRKATAPSYRPDRATLIDDYLALNPTRNRTLDFLPLFLHVDEARVRAVVADERVKARPTLHYRLPNSEIDDERWGVHVAWNDWLEVERLAADPERLDALCEHFQTHLASFLGRHLSDWAAEVGPWLAATDVR